MKSHLENLQILELKTVQNRNRNKVLTTAPLIDRGLTIDECKAICTSPIIPTRERTYFRIIYETELRPMEALNLLIENFNKDTGEVIALRVKGKKNKYIKETIFKPRHVFVSPNTIILLKSIISNRKKGYIFNGENEEKQFWRYVNNGFLVHYDCGLSGLRRRQ